MSDPVAAIGTASVAGINVGELVAMTSGELGEFLDVDASKVFTSGHFVPPSTGTFPDYDLTGVLFDPAADEKIACFLHVPTTWSSVDVYAWVMGLDAGGVRLVASTGDDVESTHTLAAFTGTRVLLAEAMSGFSAAFGAKIATFSLRRDADHADDTLAADMVLFAIECVNGGG